MSQFYLKDPEASRTYAIDWSDYLAALGDGVTISGAEWSVPDGITQVGDAAISSAVTSIKLTGGTVKTDYTVYCKITTSGEDTDRRAIVIQVRDALSFTELSEAEIQLAAVRVALGKAAAKNTSSYQIAGRMKSEHSLSELIALENRLVQIVNQERQTRALRNGSPFLQNVLTRFK